MRNTHSWETTHNHRILFHFSLHSYMLDVVMKLNKSTELNFLVSFAFCLSYHHWRHIDGSQNFGWIWLIYNLVNWLFKQRFKYITLPFALPCLMIAMDKAFVWFSTFWCWYLTIPGMLGQYHAADDVLPPSPGQHQPWYWHCSITGSLSSTRKYLNYLHHLSVGKLKRLQIYIYVSCERNPPNSVLTVAESYRLIPSTVLAPGDALPLAHESIPKVALVDSKVFIHEQHMRMGKCRRCFVDTVHDDGAYCPRASRDKPWKAGCARGLSGHIHRWVKRSPVSETPSKTQNIM